MNRARIQLWLGLGGGLMLLVAIGMAGHRAPFNLIVDIAFFGFLCLVLVLFLIPTKKSG